MADDEKVKVAAAMSLPRLGFNDSWGSIADAFRPFGIPVHRYTGAFWSQCLERVLDKFVEDEVDWAITLDYDSVFTPNQLSVLLRTFAAHPEIDAMCALQRKRAAETALLGVDGLTTDDEVVVETNNPVQVSTAHFGLTLIRMSALKRTPKPWFWGLPAPSGRWKGDDMDFPVDERWENVSQAIYENYGIKPEQQQKTDPDIWFWRQWERAGNTVAFMPGVSIGHLEIYCSHFEDDGTPAITNVDDWMRERREAEAKLAKPVQEAPDDGSQVKEVVAESSAG